jgi:hypothetical protein
MATNLDSHTNLTGNFTFYLDPNAPTASVSGAVISPFGDNLKRTIGIGTHPAGFSSDFFNGLLYDRGSHSAPCPPSTFCSMAGSSAIRPMTV